MREKVGDESEGGKAVWERKGKGRERGDKEKGEERREKGAEDEGREEYREIER